MSLTSASPVIRGEIDGDETTINIYFETSSNCVCSWGAVTSAGTDKYTLQATIGSAPFGAQCFSHSVTLTDTADWELLVTVAASSGPPPSNTNKVKIFRTDCPSF